MKRTIFITGGASGIGLACVRAFANLGDNVVIADIDFATAQEIAQMLGDNALAVHADVSCMASIQQAFDKALDYFGTVDVVHANAGVSTMKSAIEITESEWDFNFSINTKGVFFTNQIAVRHFLKRNYSGVIINTASLAGKVGAPFLAHYSASKFAVLGWTQALAREHAKDGIRVNAVCPGFVKTAMQEQEIEWEAELLGITSAEVSQSYIKQTPLGRLQETEDVADVVTFLASDGARFMTGQGVNVTGGAYMG